MFPNPSANAHVANCSRPGAFLSCVGYANFILQMIEELLCIQESTKDEAFHD